MFVNHLNWGCSCWATMTSLLTWANANNFNDPIWTECDCWKSANFLPSHISLSHFGCIEIAAIAHVSKLVIVPQHQHPQFRWWQTCNFCLVLNDRTLIFIITLTFAYISAEKFLVLWLKTSLTVLRNNELAAEATGSNQWWWLHAQNAMWFQLRLIHLKLCDMGFECCRTAT